MASGVQDFAWKYVYLPEKRQPTDRNYPGKLKMVLQSSLTSFLPKKWIFLEWPYPWFLWVKEISFLESIHPQNFRCNYHPKMVACFQKHHEEENQLFHLVVQMGGFLLHCCDHPLILFFSTHPNTSAYFPWTGRTSCLLWKQKTFFLPIMAAKVASNA